MTSIAAPRSTFAPRVRVTPEALSKGPGRTQPRHHRVPGAPVAVAYLVLHGRFSIQPRNLALMITGFGFRWYSIINQLLIWTVTGLVFGALLERFLTPQPKAATGPTVREPALS